MGRERARAADDPYDAFLSYRHLPEDRAWATWLQRALEDWRTPASLVRAAGIRPRLARVFRDEEEFAASPDLSAAIDAALARSRFLVVVCSTRTPESAWVDEEIRRFGALGRRDRVLVLLIDGEPATSYPAALRALSPAAASAGALGPTGGPLAADVRPRHGQSLGARKRRARLQLLAPILGCDYDDLAQREQQRERRRLVGTISWLSLVVGLLAALTVTAFRERDEKDRALQEVLQLADSKRIRDLAVRSDGLYPRDEASVREAQRLPADVAEALRSLPEHRSRLQRVEARSLPGTVPARFPDTTDAWTHEVLADLLRDAEALAAPGTGALARLARRFEPAAEPQAAEAWAATIAAVADTTANPVYGGLRLKPQWGLLPLGRDPRSGLFEFAHLYSGSLPRSAGSDAASPSHAALVFVLLPGGTYWRGAVRAGERNVDPLAGPDEQPVHEVRLRPFFLSKYECTQAQWERLTNERPSYTRAAPVDLTLADAGIVPRNPVEQVSWEDAAGSRGWLPRYGLRLPTEAEWEYAARAPIGADGRRDDTYSPWHVGSDPARLAAVAHYGQAPDAHPGTVGRKEPNRFGLHDLHGNVWEWCQDVYNRVSYAAWPTAQTGTPVLDPVCEAGLRNRVCRGGAFPQPAEALRSAARGDMSPDTRAHLLGLRPARSLDP